MTVLHGIQGAIQMIMDSINSILSPRSVRTVIRGREVSPDGEPSSRPSEPAYPSREDARPLRQAAQPLRELGFGHSLIDGSRLIQDLAPQGAPAACISLRIACKKQSTRMTCGDRAGAKRHAWLGSHQYTPTARDTPARRRALHYKLPVRRLQSWGSSLCSLRLMPSTQPPPTVVDDNSLPANHVIFSSATNRAASWPRA